MENDMLHMIPLVMFLIMVVTKSYRNSISNAVSVIALLLTSYIYPISPTIAFHLMAGSIFVMQIRAIVNHHDDSWVKR